MKHKLVLAAALAALTGGVAVTSAQAAPVSGHLIAKQTTDVQTVHYDGYRQRPWWWNSNRYDNDYRWRKHWWWKRHQGRDWSWRDDDRRGRDYDNHRRR